MLGGVGVKGSRKPFPAFRGSNIAAARTTRRAVNEVLEGLDLEGLDVVTADLVRSAADLVDAARLSQDAALWLRASARLEALLGKLGKGVDRGGAEVGALGDDPAARLAELVGKPASVGDGEES